MIEKLKEYYRSGVTLSYEFRFNALEKLERSILENYNDIIKAFKLDYNKCEFDVINTEVGLVLNEIKYFKKNLKKLMKNKKVKTSLINIPSKGYIIQEPYGVVFIASPWNYPFQLTFVPLIGAIASGNVIYLKASDQTKHIKQVIKNILSVFSSEYIYLVGESKEERDGLFDLPYDYVFYTGSSKVASELMAKQAKYLTPLTLELGGKSPCIVDEESEIEFAAKRIVWGKFLNAGQTCVAPDYIVVHSSIKEEFIKKVVYYTKQFYYKDNKLDEIFTNVINEKHLKRLKDLLKNEEIIFGGEIKNNTLEPTIVDNINFDSKIMEEEIFGPIMPIITYNNLNQLLDQIEKRDKPLAFYYFTTNKNKAKTVMKRMSYGGGCVNDVIMHLSEENLPFGGVGKSGMNSYHSKKSYEIFTHYKSVLSKNPKLELDIKYPKYTDNQLKFVKKFFGIKK